MLYAVGNVVLRPLTHAIYRPTVTGREHLPRRGGVILASNHLSFIDSFTIPLVAPRKVFFLAKSDYFVGTGLRGAAERRFFESIGAVSVDRASPRAAQESLDAGLEVLRRGDVFAIYPEGTRSRDGRLYRGRTGVGWLALTAGVPVVPVGLEGTDKVQPIGSNLPRLARVRVAFGEPVHPQEYADLPAGKARRAITDEVMERIGKLSGQVRADTYNSPPGAVTP